MRMPIEDAVQFRRISEFFFDCFFFFVFFGEQHIFIFDFFIVFHYLILFTCVRLHGINIVHVGKVANSTFFV